MRIIRACREMGITSVAVYSKADETSLHAQLADEAYCIGKDKVTESYLDQEAIILVAKKTGCHAIHPGYGLLSENPEFAKAVEEANLVFIGPSWQHMALMGNKKEARRTMVKLKVPVVPGFEEVPNLEKAQELAQEIGYPVMIKAASGGGGKGIKLIHEPKELDSLWPLAQKEALASFKDDSLYLEKYLDEVRHVEIQVIGDGQGQVKILGERDCSVQRRNQKLVEESPCRALSEAGRQRISQQVEVAMKELGYRGLGTVEFLMDDEENFYFMEMNTRLQVEHTVTEMVTGLDLVKWQIRVASGVDLKDLVFESRGHSIECRILAEDPRQNFLPQSGYIQFLHAPGGPQVRFDSSVYTGFEVSPYYDSLLGKLIVWDVDRDEAIRRMKSALGELLIQGITTSRDFLLEIMNHDRFKSASFTTRELEKWI